MENMRFLVTLIFGLALFWGNSQVFACEHSSSETTVKEVSLNHHKHHVFRTVSKVVKFSSCCSGVSMTCCLTVTNNLNIVKSSHRVSEELFLHSDTYKSYVAYTQLRPPCRNFV